MDTSLSPHAASAAEAEGAFGEGAAAFCESRALSSSTQGLRPARTTVAGEEHPMHGPRPPLLRGLCAQPFIKLTCEALAPKHSIVSPSATITHGKGHTNCFVMIRPAHRVPWSMVQEKAAGAPREPPKKQAGKMNGRRGRVLLYCCIDGLITAIYYDSSYFVTKSQIYVSRDI